MTSLPDRWLDEVDLLPLADKVPHDLPPLPEPPNDALLESVRISDNQNPLVPLPQELNFRRVYTEIGSPIMPPEMLLREEMAHRLCAANRSSPV